MIDFEPPKPKILVIGYSRHGKDTVSGMLSELYGLTFCSSSEFCANHVISTGINEGWTPKLRALQGKYSNAAECFADRHNHRNVWYETIRDYNRQDPTTLGREIFADYDIYCGLRNKAELHALKNARVVDLIIWVDASDRLPPESSESCTVEPWMADFIIDNNGSEADLAFNVRLLSRWIS